MRRVHSTFKEPRMIAGRERRLWYMKHGYLQTQHINKCEFVGEPGVKYRKYRWEHSLYSRHWMTIPYSRRQGNRKVWACSWLRPRPMKK